MVVRGLYYHEQKQRLPDGYGVMVKRLPPVQGVELWDNFHRLGLTGKRLGEGVFVAQFGVLDDDPAISMWGLLFYEAVLFIAFTDSPAQRLRTNLDSLRFPYLESSGQSCIELPGRRTAD